MPWKETCVTELRESLVVSVLRGEASVASLCRVAGVSRKTGYKWLERYRALGVRGLEDRSRARLTHESRVDETTRQTLVTLRREHPTWGVRKLLVLLEARHPEVRPCSASSAGRILRDAELITPTPRRRPLERPPTGVRATPEGPNHIWTVDYKGQFRLSDGVLCYPLTIADAFSRYVLRVDGMPRVSLEATRRSFVRAFEAYGLPRVIRSDNGIPFAGNGVGRLTRLSVWWMSLGIELDRITPGRPGENGRHERMHRTLKAETARPPGRNMRDQQGRFERFVSSYNHERPHEALGMAVPGSVYRRSERAYVGEVRDDDVYPGHFERRRVWPNGVIRWRGELRFIAEPLGGRLIGLCEVDDGVWRVYYRRTLIGIFDETGDRPVLREAVRAGEREEDEGDEEEDER